MALLDLHPRMAFWDIKIGGIEATGFLKRFISGMSFEYSVDGPKAAKIQVQSNSFIEDVLVPGMEVSIDLGWDRLFRSKMIDGKIVTSPNGTASEKTTYTITVVDKSIDMAKEAKNRTFPSPIKAAIVSQILAQNGYVPVVNVMDVIPIQPKELPIQKNETDLNFLYRCAAKWNCLMWFDGQTAYFSDADRAHLLGAAQKTIHMGDLFGEYQLNYRKSAARNNVESVQWKLGKKKGGIPGTPGSKGSDEDGSVNLPSDYDIEVQGKFYKLKPAIRKEIARNPTLGFRYFKMVLNTESAQAKDLLRQYFVPVVHGSRTNKQKSEVPAHKAGSPELQVKLRYGDPFLRAPRIATLDSGSEALDADLPSFLFRDSKPQKYNINQVKHTLSNGMIHTTMRLTMGKVA